MTREEQIEELRIKILRKLNEEGIKSNEEEVSFYDVLAACKSEMGLYNDFFREDINVQCTRINRKSRICNLFKRYVPLIDKVVPEISNGKEILQVYLTDKFGEDAGIIELRNQDDIRFVGYDESRFSSKENLEFISDIESSFKDTLRVLGYFKDTHEGFDYSWDTTDKNPEKMLEVSDGFLRGVIDLDNLNLACVGLSDINNIIVATTRSRKHGIIYDYVEFYNEALQKRLKVNVDGLNPTYRMFLNNYLGITKEKEMKLEK